MISIGKVFSSIKDNLGRRIFKVYQFGAKTAAECAPFGDDSNPLQGMDAVYAETSTDDEPVIIGYLNLRQMAGQGEKRLYSLKLDDDGKAQLATYIWLRSDGTIELGGKVDNAVRYTPLESALMQQNNALNIELTKIQGAISALGGSYVTQPVSLDISNSRIDEIKTL